MACRLLDCERADAISYAVVLVLGQNEIEAIRALLGSKPRPIGWSERRQRLDEVGSVWPAADDVWLEAVNCDGVPGEWSLAPGSDRSRVLLFFHGGGYCSGSILSHRRLVTEAGRAARMRPLAGGHPAWAGEPYPAGPPQSPDAGGVRR